MSRSFFSGGHLTITPDKFAPIEVVPAPNGNDQFRILRLADAGNLWLTHADALAILHVLAEALNVTVSEPIPDAEVDESVYAALESGDPR